MMSSRISKKSLNIEVQLLYAQFFHNNQLSSSYSLSLCHNLTQFQTTLYTISDNKIDFLSLRPFPIQYQPQNQNYRNAGTPLLKIVFTPVTPQSKLQSIIDQRSVIPLADVFNPKQKKMRKPNKCFLVFPLMQRGRTVVGEINIKFTFIQIDQSTQLNSSRAFGSTISKNSLLKQRKKVFSNTGKTYFNPCVSSKAITATAKYQQPDEQQRTLTRFNNSNLPQNLQFKKNIPLQNAEIQKEQPVHTQQKINQICQSKLQKLYEKNDPVQLSCDVQVPLSNHQPKTFTQQQPSENFEEIPEDYRHLFQKICEINKKYAPLQRIPSQQQLSQQTILVQKKSSNQSFYSMNSDISETKSNNHLAVAQQLLRQLNLYKFGQSLLIQNEKQKEQR